MKIGDTVKVFDRYRLASPAIATIEEISPHNDGIQVKLNESVEGGHRQAITKWPKFWVHSSQLRLV